ncbi:MAG TPA: antitoxin Xre/MbcA/ParS toxin-binding domain-containing protein [Allosphingosinicella sp.]|nr:antitoxin Xre/MbcA/ParS toxin-binding domain-containing protein [Allosphingosinicella sp.]
MRGISARGSGTIVEIEHFPHLQSSQDLKMVYSQVHPLGYDKLVLATSSMTPIAAGNPDEYVIDLRGALYGGAGDHVLDGGLGSDFIDLRESAPSDAELEQEAGELLKAARDAEGAPSLRSARRRFEEYVFSGAVDALGGAQAIGMAVRDEADLLRAIGLGFPVLVLTSLRQAGFRSDDLEGVIAPKRTLARRKAGGQRLTRVESDAAWRLAHVFSLGGRVLRGPEAAVAWLRRPKAALGDRTPVDLIETAVGAQAVERLLFQLEWGDIA